MPSPVVIASSTLKNMHTVTCRHSIFHPQKYACHKKSTTSLVKTCCERALSLNSLSSEVTHDAHLSCTSEKRRNTFHIFQQNNRVIFLYFSFFNTDIRILFRLEGFCLGVCSSSIHYITLCAHTHITIHHNTTPPTPPTHTQNITASQHS